VADLCHLCETRQCSRGYTATCRVCCAALPRPIARALDSAWRNYSKAQPCEPVQTAAARLCYEHAMAAAQAAIGRQERA